MTVWCFKRCVLRVSLKGSRVEAEWRGARESDGAFLFATRCPALCSTRNEHIRHVPPGPIRRRCRASDALPVGSRSRSFAFSAPLDARKAPGCYLDSLTALELQCDMLGATMNAVSNRQSSPRGVSPIQNPQVRRALFGWRVLSLRALTEFRPPSAHLYRIRDSHDAVHAFEIDDTGSSKRLATLSPEPSSSRIANDPDRDLRPRSKSSRHQNLTVQCLGFPRPPYSWTSQAVESRQSLTLPN